MPKPKKIKPLHERRIRAWPLNSDHLRKQQTEIHKLIGEVVAEWAAIEDLLAQLLASASGCPLNSAVIIFYSMNSFSARLSMVKAAVQHCMTKDSNQHLILCVLAKLRSLHNTRNDLIHASYSLQIGQRPTMYRKIIRSERAEPIKLIRVQTGEIETHLVKLNQALQFFAFLQFPGEERQAAARKWAAVFLNTDSITLE